MIKFPIYYLGHDSFHLFAEVLWSSPLMVTENGYGSVCTVIWQHLSSNWIIS